MGTTGILLIATFCTVSNAVIIGKKCDRSGDFLQITVEINTEGDVFQYITFKDNTGTQLRNKCGSENGDFTGTGTASDPFQIAISVNSSQDIGVGTPDCGHVADGDHLTWTLFIVYDAPPFPNAVGRTIEQDLYCNFTEIVQQGSVGVSVNNTAVETFQTVRLHHTSIALEFRIVKESFQEYGPTESFMLADNVRLRLRAVNNITGLYGYNCKACNTPHCDKLVFPILDSNGCKFPEFTSILGTASADLQPSNIGTFMFPNAVVPGFDFSIYAGMAFSEEFRLFRFIGSSDVYFTCSVGYCSNPDDVFCTQHCREAIGARKRRDIRRNEESEDYTITVVKVMGDNKRFMLGYPESVPESVPKEVFINMTVPHLAPESCMSKAQYISVFAILGTVLLGTSVAAAVIGAKLVARKLR